jgi:hypothetical protein
MPDSPHPHPPVGMYCVVPSRPGISLQLCVRSLLSPGDNNHTVLLYEFFIRAFYNSIRDCAVRICLEGY